MIKERFVSLCRFGVLITGILFAAPSCLSAQKKASEEVFEKIYEKLKTEDGVKSDSVKYTGSDISKAHGFAFQRGYGSGWTRGCRLTLDNVAKKTVERIREKYEAIKDIQYVNLKTENSVSTYFEDIKTAYLYSYDADKRRLYFLKAVSEGEICVPYNWTDLDYLDVTEHNPLKDIDEKEARMLGLSRLWSAVSRNFVFMNRVKISWDSLYVDNMKRMYDAKDRDECFLILQRMAAQLHDGHTFVYGASPFREYVPFTTVYIGGRVYVDKVLSRDMEKQGLRRGMELVSVNGESAVEYGSKHVMPYVSSSTTQWTLNQTYCGRGLLKGKKNDTFAMDFRSDEGQLRLTYVLGSGGEDVDDSEPVMRLEVMKGNIGYLRISDFMADDFTQTFDRLYNKISATSALIIDIRDNSGGNSNNADYVVRHLITDSVRTNSWSSPVYIPAFASWNMRHDDFRSKKAYVRAVTDKEVYTKPVVLLVNGGTFSAAEDFCSIFKSSGRGLIMGTRTGGSTGNGVRVTLIPGHSYANICSKHDVMPDGTEFVGIGIVPDVEVEETYDSYFNTKEGAQLNEALARLRNL